jgi:hypothetical protein
LSEVSILVWILQGHEKEIFWEVSNKETYLANEGGMVFEYLQGSEYLPNYKGFDPYGEVVPCENCEGYFE